MSALALHSVHFIRRCPTDTWTFYLDASPCASIKDVVDHVEINVLEQYGCGRLDKGTRNSCCSMDTQSRATLHRSLPKRLRALCVDHLLNPWVNMDQSIPELRVIGDGDLRVPCQGNKNGLGA